MRYLIAASGEQLFPEGGGMLIRNGNGEVIGAVGVTGDTEDRDEELAAIGIRAAGLENRRGLRRQGPARGLAGDEVTAHPVAKQQTWEQYESRII